MNRLATVPTDRRSGLTIVLEHLADSHPDEYTTALDMMRAPKEEYGNVTVADALTDIAREDNLRVEVNEKSIRDWRKRNRLSRDTIAYMGKEHL